MNGNLIARGCTAPVAGKTKHDTPCIYPCGQCFNCLLSQKGHSIARAGLEIKAQAPDTTGVFATYTLDDERNDVCDPYDTSEENQKLLLAEHTKSINHLRKIQERYEKKHGLRPSPIRYYTATDYGTDGHRLHLHPLLYGVRPELMLDHFSYGKIENRQVDVPWWKYGKVVVKPMSVGTIKYVANHGLKALTHGTAVGDGVRYLRRMSTQPSLGSHGIQQLADNVAYAYRHMPHKIKGDIKVKVGKGSYPLPPILKEKFLDRLKQKYGLKPRSDRLSIYETYRVELITPQSAKELRATVDKARLDMVHSGLHDKFKSRFYSSKSKDRM